MDSNSNILAAMKRQQEIKSYNGVTSLLNIAQAIQKNNQPVNVSFLDGLVDLTTKLSTQMKPLDIASTLAQSSSINIAQSLFEQQKNMNFGVLGNFSSMLKQIEMQNEQLSNSISNVALSQMTVSNSMIRLAESIGAPNLAQFNGINAAIQGITNSYLKSIGFSKSWDDLELVEEVNETISEASDQIVTDESSVTKEDLEKLRISILTELSALFAKMNSPTARQYVQSIISVLCLFFGAYGFYTATNSAKYMEELHNSNIKVLENIKEEIYTKIDNEFRLGFELRIARTNVNLRYSNNKRSKKIGLVRQGQEVTVIEIRHKWLLISYIDYETGEPMSGFVYKKYFDQTR